MSFNLAPRRTTVRLLAVVASIAPFEGLLTGVVAWDCCQPSGVDDDPIAFGAALEAVLFVANVSVSFASLVVMAVPTTRRRCASRRGTDSGARRRSPLA